VKILVTGGAGFIASHVADRFIADGHDVVIVDNLATGFRENVNPKARFYELDIRDPKVADVFAKERPDVVDHHAAQMDVRRSVREPLYDAEVNVLGTLRLLELSREVGVKRWIYVSTGGAVYGEPQSLPVREDHPINPLSPYGATKHTPEHYLFIYRQLHGLQSVVLRYANIYGPRQSPHGEAGVTAIFSENMLLGKPCTLFGDGSKTRDYVFIEDVVRANVAALSKGDGGVFNIGTGRATTDFEIFDLVRKAVGKPDLEPLYGDKRPGEIDHIHLANERARDGLGWVPEVSLEDGVRRSAAFYREKLVKQGKIAG
jgi:UDP-glucose 4-epimerase